MDDAGPIAKSEDQARNLFNRIADEDLDGHLGWEMDYPSSTDQFIPFLGTQIRISEEGGLESKYYRKEQKKQITLNFKSHHPMNTKVEVARNSYKTAHLPQNCQRNPTKWSTDYSSTMNTLTRDSSWSSVWRVVE